MSKTASSPSDDQTENTLDLGSLLEQLSGALGELSDTCADLQGLQATEDQTMNSNEVMRAQALDRVTQTLKCLSAFSSTLALQAPIEDISVSADVLSSINLLSVQNILKSSPEPDELDVEKIELF